MTDGRFREDLRFLADELIYKLSQAFVTGSVPARFPAPRSNDEADCDAVFGGKRWDEIPDEAIGGALGSNCLSVFDAWQARYYLPAFLRYLLRDMDDRIDRPAFYHSVGPRVVHATPQSELLRSLDEEERRCVAEFLVLLSKVYAQPERSPDAAAQAMEAARLWAWGTPSVDLSGVEAELSDPLRGEREALRTEIEGAFADVELGQGVSWRESVAADLGGSRAEQAALRRLDGTGTWRALVDDPSWDPDSGVGGWVVYQFELRRNYITTSSLS